MTRQGRLRPSLADAQISPRPASGELPIWVGVGGTLASAERAGRLGLPLTLANISQPPAKLGAASGSLPARRAERGHDAARLRVAVASHLHVAPDSAQAREQFYPHYSAYFQHHAPKSSYQAAVPRELFDERAARTGALFVGSPQEIVDKILYERELFGHERFLAQVDIGRMPYAEVGEGHRALGNGRRARAPARGCGLNRLRSSVMFEDALREASSRHSTMY